MFNFTGWTDDAADSAVDGMEENSFEKWWLKLLVTGFLIWGTWKVVLWSVFYIGLGCGFILKWYHQFIEPLVQGALHLFGGK